MKQNISAPTNEPRFTAKPEASPMSVLEYAEGGLARRLYDESPQAVSPEAVPHERIRILIDARKLGQGGIGVYLENLIAALMERAELKLSVLARRENLAEFDWPADLEIIEDNAKSYSIDEMFRLARRIDQSKFDIFHAPHFTLPFGLKIPSVVTIHDLIHLSHPEHAYYPLVASPLILAALKRASRIIVVSAATRHEIIKRFGLKPEIINKISIIPNAVDPIFEDTAFFRRQGRISWIGSQNLRFQGPYFMTVLSNSKPHKGVRDLLHAFAEFKAQAKSSAKNYPTDAGQRLASELKLVIVGQGTQNLVDQANLMNLVAQSQDVYLLGEVSKAELASLYAGAKALVVPSRAEGFCLPMLEAKACGTKVILTPVPAMLELMGPGDLACSGMEAGAIADGMQRWVMRETDPRSNTESEPKSDITQQYSRARIGELVANLYAETNRTRILK